MDNKDEKLFDKDELVRHEKKDCRVIAEYERTICIEYIDYPFPDEEEKYPHPRVIVRKDEVERLSS